MMFPVREEWDEFRWEEYLRREERKTERCLEIFFRNGAAARAPVPSWMIGPLPELDGAEEGMEDTSYAEDPARRGEYRCLAVYRRACEFAAEAMRFVERLPDRARCASATVDFLASAGLSAARIGRGSFIGSAFGEPGGNIACSKRALASANAALAALREMREREIAPGPAYLALASEGTEMRDAIALYVLELREEFRLRAA